MTTLARVTWSPRIAIPAAAVAAAVAALCILLGPVGRVPLLAVAAVAGLVAAYVLLVRPWLAAAVLVAVNVSNASDVVGYHAGLSLYLVTLAIALGSLGYGVATKRLTLRWSPVLLLPGVWLAMQVPSIVTAHDNGVAMAAVTEHAKSVVMLVTVLLIAVGTGRMGAILQSGVLVIACVAALTLVNQFVFHDATNLFGFSNVPKVPDLGGATARHSGPEADPNFWGRTLLLFLPLALGLFAGRVRVLGLRGFLGSPRWWLVAAASITGGVYLTGSRGALIAAVAAVVLWLLLAGRRYRAMLLLTPVLAVAIAFVPGVGSRLGTLTELSQVSEGQGDPSLVDRAAAQEVGLAMVESRPVFGVGAGNFATAWPRYATAAASSTLVQVAPHNLYLQIAAETGLVGLAGWLLLFGGVLLLALRTYLARSLPRPPPERAVHAGLFAALTGWAVASIVLHLSDERTLFCVIAVACAYAIEERRKAVDAPDAVATGWSAWPRLRATAIGVAVCAAAFAVGVQVVGIHQAAYRAEVVVPIKVGPTRSSDSAYYYDVLSRQEIVPTYASLLATEGVKARAADSKGIDVAERDAAVVHVTGDARTLLLRLDVSSPDRDVARRLATGIATDTRAQLDRTSNVYRIGAPTMVSEPRPVSSVEISRVIGLVLAAIVVGGCAALPFRRRRGTGRGTRSRR